MRRHAAAALSALAIFGAACGGAAGTPSEQLSDALADLRGTDFSYAITLDIDNDVLSRAAAADPTIGQASLFAGSFSMRGAYKDDDASFSVSVMGTDAMAMRILDDGAETYVQFGIVDLMAGFGMNPDDLLSEMQAQGGIPAGAEGFIQAFLSGGWVGFENDPEAFEALVDDEYRELYGDPTAMRDAFKPLIERFADPAKLIEDYGTVTESDQVDGLDILVVDVQLRSLLGDLARDFATAMESQADSPAFSDLGADFDDFENELQEGLAEVPETVPGLTVGLRDGKVERMTFDLGVAAASMGNNDIAPGAALIVIELDRSDVPDIVKPADSTFFTSEQLVEMMKSLQEATAGV